MNKISKDFDPPLYYANYLIRKRLLQHLQALIPRMEGRLLDFGCGQKPYKALFAVSEYIGLDFENPGHPHLNESIDVFYDGKTIPFSGGHFDSIFASEVFEHVFNLPEMLKELNRVLKIDGKMLFTCPFAFCEHEVPNDYARYTSFAIRHLLQENGFEIIEQHKTGNSIETIQQLQLTYINSHIYPKLKKIPLLRSGFRIITYSLANCLALLLGRIFPSGKELYMNNVVLCRKVKNLEP